MSDQNEPMQGGALPSVPLQPVVQCGTCEREWPVGCEQAVAIRKRGCCIVCLIAQGAHFSMDPYEFERDPDPILNPTSQTATHTTEE